MSRRDQWADYVDKHYGATELGQKAKPKGTVRVPSAAEKCLDALVFQCHMVGLPAPEREHKFCEGRRFRFDCAWLEPKLALEVDGGVFMAGGGRHNRGAGYRQDCEKGALAAIRGWRVMHVLPEHVTNGQAIGWIKQALSGVVEYPNE